MAFPTVATSSSNNSGGNASTTEITLPASIATGDLLLVAFTKDGSAAPTSLTGSGWALLDGAANGTAVWHGVYWKIADGTDALTINHASEGTAWAAYRITGHDGATAPEIATAATGASANPNPGSLDPAAWATEDTLWVVSYGWDGNISHTSYPANYASNPLTERWPNTNGCGVAVATRENAASSEDPGTATLSGSDEWVAYTVGVRPSSGLAVTTGLGELVVTGTVPTLAVSDNQSVDAGLGALTIAGHAPTVVDAPASSSTLYYVIYPSALAAPSAAQVKAGQNVNGDPATASGNEAARTTTGEQVFAAAATELTQGTGYKVSFVWNSGATDSNVETSAEFFTQSEVSAGVGALTIAGLEPTIAVSAAQEIATGLGGLLLTGLAPTVGQTYSVDAGLGALVLTGLEPTVTATAGQQIALGVGALALTGYEPTIRVSLSAAPGVGALLLTGHAPTLGFSYAVASGLGALTIAGHAPDVVKSEPGAITTGLGALTLTGYEPALSYSYSVGTGLAALAITGHAPTLGFSYSVGAGLGALTLTGYEPTIRVSLSVQAGLGALSITGLAPTVGQTHSAAPGVAALSIAGHVPAVVATSTGEIGTGLGELVLSGHAPTVVGGIELQTRAYPGPAGRPKRRRYVVEVDGEDFLVDSLEEAQALLERAVEVAQEVAPKVIQKAQRKARRKGQDAPVAVEVPEVKVRAESAPRDDLAAVRALVDRMQAEIDAAYKEAARNLETQALIRARMDDDEEDALLALLL